MRHRDLSTFPRQVYRLPEDGGSLDGFADFLEAMADPGHSEHDAMTTWYALIGALDADDGADLREQVRSLAESIQLIPEAGSLRIEVRGALGAILQLASWSRELTKALTV